VDPPGNPKQETTKYLPTAIDFFRVARVTIRLLPFPLAVALRDPSLTVPGFRSFERVRVIGPRTWDPERLVTIEVTLYRPPTASFGGAFTAVIFGCGAAWTGAATRQPASAASNPMTASLRTLILLPSGSGPDI
jgi:hypothetical protein